MLGEDDLAVFFNPDEHALPATIKEPGGATLRTANVIFNDAVQEMQVGQGEVGHAQPSLMCPTADLAGVRKNFIFEIEGRGTFRVVRQQSDGTGVSTVFLARG